MDFDEGFIGREYRKFDFGDVRYDCGIEWRKVVCACACAYMYSGVCEEKT